MKCNNCGCKYDELFELVGSEFCENCWQEYWRDNDIGLRESFEDFKQFTLKKCISPKQEVVK